MSTPPRPRYGYGGYAAAARFLTLATGRPVSRQMVHLWDQRRAVTGFPEPVTVTTVTGRTYRFFRLEDVLLWKRGRQRGG